MAQQVNIRSPLMIIVTEPAIGYLLPILQKHYPLATLVALHFHPELYALRQWDADYTWHTQLTIPLEQFLLDCINRLPSPRIATVIPSYVHTISPRHLRHFNRAISHVVRLIRSDLATVGYFGRKWITNSIANTLFYNRSAYPQKLSDYVVCIVGSGPTLSETVHTLSMIQHSVLIFSLPSALPCLYAHGVAVDMVVSTDGGFWATKHFAECARRRVPRVAMPLTATRELYKYRPSAVIFNQQFCIERELVTLFHPHAPTLHAYGTVAASAAELAIALQAQQVLLFGIDGGYIDGMLHCRPHSFQSYYTHHSSLLHSMDDELLRRLIDAPRVADNSALRIPRAHTVYKEELQGVAQRSPVPVSAVTPINAPVGFSSISPRRAAQYIREAEAPSAVRAIEVARGSSTGIFIEKEQRVSGEKKRTALGALLRSYRRRVMDASYEQPVDRDVSMLMCALAAQQFHAFWRTIERTQWHALQQRCADELQRIEERYR